MQTQQTRTLQVLPAHVVALVFGLLVVVMLAGTFGFWLRGVSLSHETYTPVSVGAVGKEQIAHNRSEEGIGGTSTVGAQQVAHDRSEQGLSDPLKGVSYTGGATVVGAEQIAHNRSEEGLARR